MLKNQKILVLGAGGLLGSKVVVEALSRGAGVIAVDLDEATVRARLAGFGLSFAESCVEFFEADLTDEENLIDLFQSISGLSGAVNCSYPRGKNYGKHFYDVSLNNFNESLSLHLGSAFLVMQQCASYFERNKLPFSLVNISSIYGVVAPKFDIYKNTSMTMPVEYAAIKSAIVHLNRYVAAYVGDSRFRVNSVSPGGIFDNQPESFLKSYKSFTHGEGMLDVGDVVGVILFLLSADAKFITGQNVIVDDGFCL